MTRAERSDVLADLYYRSTGCVAPGHDSPAALYQESSSPENHERFRSWVVAKGFAKALDRIAQLEAEIRELDK